MFSETLDAFARSPQLGELIFEPVARESVALRASTVVRTSAPQYRIPRLTDDPSADWIGANSEIPASEASGDEVVVVPQKLAGLSYIGNELASDTDPSAHVLIGQRLAVDSARKLDAAFFGPDITDDQDPDYNAHRPRGLESLASAATRITANPAEGVDPWVDAFYAAEELGLTLDAWVAHPGVAKSLATLKTGTGSNSPLLQDFVDGKRIMFGTKVWTSPYVTPGTVWGLPSNRAFAVVRKDIDVTFDTSVRFHYDQVAVRSTIRAAFGFPAPSGIILIRA